MPKQIDGRFRLMGFLTLSFFLVQAFHYWSYGEMYNLLWMCNVGNVLLTVGLFLAQREVIRAAAIWTIPGLFLWATYVTVRLLHPEAPGTRMLWLYSFIFSSALAHLGGLLVGMIAVRRMGMDRMAWLYAFIWYLFMQLVSRLFTPPDLNVNVAYSLQRGWKWAFSSYWKFWIVMSAVTAAGVWTFGRILGWLWPADKATQLASAKRLRTI